MKLIQSINLGFNSSGGAFKQIDLLKECGVQISRTKG